MPEKETYPISIAVFFTRGVSLREWDIAGIFEREVALYRNLQLHGVSVTFVTYGDKRDLAYAGDLPGVTICCNKWSLPESLYANILHRLHAKGLHGKTLFKTNQLNGAEIALHASHYHRCPLVTRCGYMWSKNMILEYGSGSAIARKSLAVENSVFSGAKRIVVTTERMSQDVIDRVPEASGKISVIPNYVDTTLFQPSRSKNCVGARICFIGRLSPEKNLSALISAVSGLDIQLHLIGEGPLKDELVRSVPVSSNVTFCGRMETQQLSARLSEYDALILPSFYEGHPKVVIEAMACGVPVIGTDVSGINDIIKHGVTGWLCGTDMYSLREGIRTVLSDPLLRQQLVMNALKYVHETCSLSKVVDLEMRLYRDVL